MGWVVVVLFIVYEYSVSFQTMLPLFRYKKCIATSFNMICG